MAMKRIAVFLDRDGTINFDPGYLSSPRQLRIFPAARKGLKLLREKGFSLFIVTNQSGIGRGFFSRRDLDAVHKKLLGELEKDGIAIREIAFCPHHPDEGCDCRKPSPEMVHRLADKYDIDLKKSFFVGDKPLDVLTGINAGCGTVLLAEPEKLSELRRRKEWVEPDYIAEDLQRAALFITSSPQKNSGRESKTAVGIIPARYRSRRFPGKLLARLGERTVIEEVYRRASRAKLLDDLLVATSDKRIQKAVLSFGGKVVLTSSGHRSGTERVAEASRGLKTEIVINIQGDEPFIRAAMIDRLVEELLRNRRLNLVTLAKKISSPSELADPDTVKVVMNRQGFACYFSRSPIPHHPSGGRIKAFKHIGLYCYRKKFLLKFPALPRGRLEKQEKLEQLRVLENGYKIKILKTKWDTIGIDTPSDLKKARKLLSA